MASNVEVVIRAFRDFSSRLVRQIVLDATANLIEDTPRDTGWAAANWFPTFGASMEGTGPGRDSKGRFTSARARPEESELASELASARSTQDQLTAAVAVGYQIDDGDVVISNHVPYIGRLNDGHSKQAPAGFVQAAVARAVSGVRSFQTPEST